MKQNKTRPEWVSDRKQNNERPEWVSDRER